MARSYPIYIWKKAPFVRLLLPLIAGILLEYYFNIPIDAIIVAGLISLILIVAFSLLPASRKFVLRSIQGFLIASFLVLFGLFITWQKDIRNHQNWYGNSYSDSSLIVASIIESPVEKAKSYKATATVESCINGDSQKSTVGKVILYLEKDSLSERLHYGDQLILSKSLKEIRNSGNPAGFDYARYMAFQQIFQQVYVKKKDWILLQTTNANPYLKFLFHTRDVVINTIDRYIPGEDESALAKALLIGYRIDLDKDLLQAYSNAGVVHIIAISGLHIGLIYALLLWITMKIPLLKKARVPRILVILFCLWFFVFLTGAPPSVMRAAVMFSFISVGSVFRKTTSIYNSLAASAFLLLSFDPFLFWDAGFQLSYLAVLGIVVLQKPVYGLLYFKNKLLDYTWKMAAVSIAAQVFTIPVCFYYFHQLPLLFLIANLIVIPLSTVALCGCIALLAVSPLGIIPVYIGKLVAAFLFAMNYTVHSINLLPFLLWDNVSISASETILLYFVFIAFITWMLKKNVAALKWGLAFTLVYTASVFAGKWNSSRQKKIIVYNVPMHSAIDFVDGHQFHVIADRSLLNDPLLQKYNLIPTRISLHANNEKPFTNPIFHQNNFVQFYDQKIMVVDSPNLLAPSSGKIKLNYIVISKNPKIKISQIAQAFDCERYVFDGSNAMWKIEQWKKECEELHLQFHSVPEQGAFVINQ